MPPFRKPGATPLFSAQREKIKPQNMVDDRLIKIFEKLLEKL